MSDELRDITPAKVLAAHQQRFDPRASFYEVSCNCGEWTSDTINSHKTKLQLHTEHQLDALKASGYEVVKLPNPVGVNGADNRVWSHEPHYIEQEFNGDIVIDDRLGIDCCDLAIVGEILLAAFRSTTAHAANAADATDGA